MSPGLDLENINGLRKQDNYPYIIAGPCSAESKEQVMQIAESLSKIDNIKAFRAGIWKPRTRPAMFEGVGDIGLEWLKEVKQKYAFKTAVEVATPEHIEKCLNAGIDIIWIGARTTVNPFSVQELADAIKGADVSVLVKNPLHPELKLWLGAIERFNKSGIKKLGAIHRGFYTYEKHPYRNLPMWEIPIELKRIAPDLPVFNDPSHISGKRKLLESVTQKAMDLAMDGIMIETHNNPDKALTDSKQQITPENLKRLLSNLIFRNTSGDEEFKNELELLRHEINQIDNELLTTLSRRMQKSKEIGLYKKQHNITVLQIQRFREMLKERIEIGEELDLDKEFVMSLLSLVHKESIQRQFKVFGD